MGIGGFAGGLARGFALGDEIARQWEEDNQKKLMREAVKRAAETNVVPTYTEEQGAQLEAMAKAMDAEGNPYYTVTVKDGKYNVLPNESSSAWQGSPKGLRDNVVIDPAVYAFGDKQFGSKPTDMQLQGLRTRVLADAVSKFDPMKGSELYDRAQSAEIRAADADHNAKIRPLQITKAENDNKLGEIQLTEAQAQQKVNGDIRKISEMRGFDEFVAAHPETSITRGKSGYIVSVNGKPVANVKDWNEMQAMTIQQLKNDPFSFIKHKDSMAMEERRLKANEEQNRLHRLDRKDAATAAAEEKRLSRVRDASDAMDKYVQSMQYVYDDVDGKKVLNPVKAARIRDLLNGDNTVVNISGKKYKLRDVMLQEPELGKRAMAEIGRNFALQAEHENQAGKELSYDAPDSYGKMKWEDWGWKKPIGILKGLNMTLNPFADDQVVRFKGGDAIDATPVPSPVLDFVGRSATDTDAELAAAREADAAAKKARGLRSGQEEVKVQSPIVSKSDNRSLEQRAEGLRNIIRLTGDPELKRKKQIELMIIEQALRNQSH